MTDHAPPLSPRKEASWKSGHTAPNQSLCGGKRTYVPERETAKVVREEIRDRAQAEAEMEQGLAAGALKFCLYGAKFQGSFALIRTRGLRKKRAGCSSSTRMAIRNPDMVPMRMISPQSAAAPSSRLPLSRQNLSNPPSRNCWYLLS